MAMEISELQVIVEALNNEPFNLGLTLVAFHGKSSIELLQLVNDIFAYLDSAHKSNIRDEPEAQYKERMLSFLLGVLNYKPADGDIKVLSEKFIAGDQGVIYPFLFWMLDQLGPLKKRAYLFRYLKNVDVPEEMFADTAVVSLFQEYKALQGEFKEVHKMTDKERQGKLDPNELQTEIEQLTTEKEQLLTKLTKLKEKVPRRGA